MITRRFSLSLITLAAGMGLAPQADAGARENQEAARAALQRGEIRPLTEILAIVAREVPGDVIKVELESEHGAFQYEIKVLTASGRVREVKLDARNGAILEIEDE